MRLPAVVRRILRLPREEQRTITGLPWDIGGALPTRQVSPEQALSLVPVFGAVRLLASQIASLPLQTYRKVGDGRMKLSTPSLFAAPAASGTLYTWLHRCVTSLALRGNAYGLVTARDSYGFPTMVEWLHPDHVTCQDTALSGPGSYIQPLWYWLGRLVPTEDLVHIAWFTIPGRVQGLSPIEACAVTISTGVSAQVYTADWFNNGAVPPGKFKNTQKTVNQTESDEIKARLAAAIRTRKPLVYGADWEYDPITVSAHEAKFVETMQLNATQIASIYGVPPEMIGGQAGGALTYNTVEQNAINFTKFTLRPWLELLEETFSALLPRPQYVKFNLDALLRGDLGVRTASYRTWREIGMANVDELRALEDQAPLPNGEGKDYTPLLVQVAASRGIDAAQVHANQPVSDQPATRGRAERRKFNPDEPRVPGGEHGGEWGHGGGALRDALKLAGKIDLEPDEKLAGSDKISGTGGTVRLALTELHGHRSLRLGVGGENFGGRYDEAGPWRGNRDRTEEINAERKRLSDEQDRIGEELDRLEKDPHADPARKAALQARYDELDDMDKGEVVADGYTAKLSQSAAEHLRSTLADALDKGKQLQAEIDAGREPPRPEAGYFILAEGSVPGEWADVHYEVYLDDPSIGVEVHLGAIPHGSGLDLNDLGDQRAILDPSETRKLLRLLGQHAGMSTRGGSLAGVSAAVMLLARRHDPLDPLLATTGANGNGRR